jgi:DNA-binding MarR family transcriptional regulator
MMGSEEEPTNVSDISSSGPLSNSVRFAIMAVLLGARRVTFSELLKVVKIPKSSLSKNLDILEEMGLVTQRRGFLGNSGTRKFIEITGSGEQEIKNHLNRVRDLANKLLPTQTNDADETQDVTKKMN